MDRTTAKRLGFTEASGVLVADVLPYSPADRKGVQPGMKLVAVGDKRVANAAEARTLLRAAPSGEVISLLFENSEGRTRIANVRNP
jgi:serine protease Do